MKERVIAAAKKMKREQWIVCGLVGILLLVIAMPVKHTEQDKDSETETADGSEAQGSPAEEDIRLEYEQQLAAALENVQGVGAVRVTLTMESTGRKIVEKDQPQDSQTTSQSDPEGGESQSESLQSQETTVFEEREDGSQVPYVASETYPEIRGVLVVAQGGDDPVIVRQIQEAVMALFHVEAHNIKVMKMK